MQENETGPRSPFNQPLETGPEQVVLERRAARAAESLLDNESLTGDLDDQAAGQLLNWGTGCARRIAHDTVGLNDSEAEIAMEPRLRALRRWMRSVGSWSADQPGPEAERQMASLATIIEQSTEVYGEGFSAPDQKQCEAFLSQLSATRPGPYQFIAALRELLEGHVDVR